MSEEYSKISVRSSFQGKSLPDSIKKAIKDYFDNSSLSENECKDRLSSFLGGKNKTSRKSVYKDLDFDYEERKRVEDIICN